MNENKMEYQREGWEEKRKRRYPAHPVIEAFVTSKINYVRDYVV